MPRKTKGKALAHAPAMALLNQACAYQDAAGLLFNATHDSLSDPINFLYFQAVELALKAFLRSHNVPLRKGHRITKFYTLCRGLGLVVGPDDRVGIENIVNLLESGNADQQFRYPSLKSSVRADLSWTAEVVEQLIRAVELHADPHKTGRVPGPAATTIWVWGKPVPKDGRPDPKHFSS